MKHFKKHIVLYVFLLFGINATASHILGGEIFYKHVQNNQYLVTVNIYRDCNGCKINGNGGGSSSENCSEIDYVYVKGSDNSSSKETKFALERQKIVDISSVCKSKYSVCNSKSSSNYGIELQQFTSLVNLDNSAIKGYCNYQLYVSVSERNANITTGMAEQNFCVDAFIQACVSNNNSPVFITNPTFIIDATKVQYQSYFAKDLDNDSLVFSLTPALSKIDKEATYYSNYTYENPLKVYCIGTSPCAADKVKQTGFYIDRNNGAVQFLPVQESEIGVVVVKVEEYRKIAGKWELLGYIKRDIQVYVKTSNGNNSPVFLNQNYFEICEEEELVIKIEAKDDKNTNTSEIDSVSFSLNSSIEGSDFKQVGQSAAPFNYSLFSWKPKKGASSLGLYSFNVSATDNFCPFNSWSAQTITIKVKPKEELIVKTKDLGCGNFEIKSTTIAYKSKLLIEIETINKKQLFKTSLPLDTISLLPPGKYFIKAVLTSENGCKTFFNDTFICLSNKSNAIIKGNSEVCKSINYTYEVLNLPSSNNQLVWIFDSMMTYDVKPQNFIFSINSSLLVALNSKKGKWICIDTLKKDIAIIKLPKIESLDEIKYCNRVENILLSTINIKPVDGLFTSKNNALVNDFISTAKSNRFEDDTILLNYEITHLGCKDSKNINIIIEALPEFKLSSTSICEIKSPIVLNNMVQKPYKIENYTVLYNFPLSPEKLKFENGFYVFYPNEMGFGTHPYQGIITGKNGCKNYDTATIEITPFVNITFDNEINICEGSGLIDLNQVSGVKPNNGTWSFYSFDLIKNRKFANTDTCGTFELTYIYDNYGCYDSKQIKVTIACKPDMAIIGLPEKVCDRLLPLTLHSNLIGGIWGDSSILDGKFSPPLSETPITHTIHYYYKKGTCTFKESRKITVNPSPKVNLVLNKGDFCNGEPIAISGSVKNTNSISFRYLINSKEDVFNNSKQYNKEVLFNSKFDKAKNWQDVSVFAQNDEGCINMQSLILHVYDIPKIELLEDTVICENSGLDIYPKIEYEGSDQLNFSWLENANKIEVVKNLNTDKLKVGKHSIEFKAENTHCNNSKSLNIEVKPKPFVDFVIQPATITTIKQPTFWFLNQSNQNQSWLWDFGTNQMDNFSNETNTTYSYRDTGTYEVSLKGTNEFGCSDLRKRTLIVRPDLLIFIPNAFSPNNRDEEKNNVFGVKLQNYISYRLEIFDRWGHKLFVSENPEETWDGTADGNICTPDIYLYSINIMSITNQKYYYRGTITLIK